MKQESSHRCVHQDMDMREAEWVAWMHGYDPVDL